MTSTPPPICLGCKFLKSHPERETGMTCGAFPEGIPTAIINSTADHRRPYPGDSSIRFEAKTPQDAQYAEKLFSR